MIYDSDNRKLKRAVGFIRQMTPVSADHSIDAVASQSVQASDEEVEICHDGEPKK